MFITGRYLELQQSASSDTNRTQVADPTRLNWLVSVGWLLVMASLIIVVINIPLFYQDVYNRAAASPALTAAGVPPELIAILRTIVRRVGEACFFIMAAAILLRSRNQMAILMGITGSLLAVVLSGAVLEVELAVPALSIPIRILTVLAVGLAPLLMFTLPNGEFVPKWSRYLLLFIVIEDSIRLSISSLSLIFLAPSLAIDAISIWAQVYRYRRQPPVYQHQFKWLILGASAAVISVIVGQACYVLVPRDFHVLTSGIDEIGSLILAVCTIFAVTRYRLYDINLFIHRTVVYWAVFTAMAVIFAIQFFILRAIFVDVFDQPNHPLGVVIPLLISAALFNPLRSRIQHVIDRRVYGFRFDLDQLANAEKPLEVKHPGQYTGKNVGGFQLHDVIGKGGMGEVYKGVSGEKVAAVKVMDSMWEFDIPVKERFEREGKLTAAISHPNIVKTYGYGVSEGVYYVALEYINGPSLAQLLQERRRLSLEDISPFVSRLADALDMIHAQGYVHRDIKPSNIMMRIGADLETYEPVLMDFGIAKLMDDDTSQTDSSLIGTIRYMSPEQIQQAEKVDHRTDIYAMGIVLYELLTGDTPFSGSIGQILFAHLHQPPPNPCDIIPELPPQVAYVVMRALSKDREYRFQTAKEMADTLLLASSQEPVSV